MDKCCKEYEGRRRGIQGVWGVIQGMRGVIQDRLINAASQRERHNATNMQLEASIGCNNIDYYYYYHYHIATYAGKHGQ